MPGQVGQQEQCFICRQQLENCEHCRKCQNQSKVKGQRCRLFCGLISRHLNLRESRFHFEAATTLSNQNENENSFLHTCDHCYEMVDNICKIYDEWKKLELKLNWNLKRLSEFVSENSDDPNTDPNISTDEVDHLDIFRREFLHQVQSANLSKSPNLRLEKINQEKATTSDGQGQDKVLENSGVILNSAEIKSEDEEVEIDTRTMWADLQLESEPDEIEASSTPPPAQSLDLERGEIPNDDDDVYDESEISIVEHHNNRAALKTEAEKCHQENDDDDDDEERENREVTQKNPETNKTSVANSKTGKSKSTAKLFQCSRCPKTYRRQDNLKRHALSHVGMKPYECSVCGEKFSRKDYHLNHERKHRGEPTPRMLKARTIPCRFCRKCFTVNSLRIQHEWTHTGFKPFGCSICGKRFKSHAACGAHLRKSHKKEEGGKVIRKK